MSQRTICIELVLKTSDPTHSRLGTYDREQAEAARAFTAKDGGRVGTDPIDCSL
jgi:hypothetical protein